MDTGDTQSGGGTNAIGGAGVCTMQGLCLVMAGWEDRDGSRHWGQGETDRETDKAGKN